MRAETAQTEAFDDGRLGLEGRECCVGSTSFGVHADDEIFAKLRVNALRVLRERLVHGRQLERRPAALEDHFDLGVWDQLFLDALPHLLLDSIVFGDAHHAPVRRR